MRPSLHSLPLGAKLGRYIVRRRIGSGGMGVVYEADDPETGAVVAIKTLPELEAAALYRFKREFRALVDVSHPNLVTLHELVSDSGHWFYAMELVDGVDFLTWVRGGQVYEDVVMPTGDDGQRHSSPERLARVRHGFHQLVSGIAAIHAAGKVHRDIKPGNILVTPQARVVLLDFGLIGDRPGGDLSSDSIVVGTATYMAPEQAGPHRVGPAADWYSVGVVLYQSLTGKTPYTGTPLRVLAAKQRSDPVPPRSISPEVPDDLNDLCMSLLRRPPGARPEAERILARLSGDGPGVAVPAATSESFSRARPFIGREAELAALLGHFERIADEGARIVCITGDTGVGKSALAARLASRITRDHPNAVVLTGRTHERESVPFNALDGLVDALSEHLSKEPEVAGLLSDDAPLVAQQFPVLGRVEAIVGMQAARGEVVFRGDLRPRAFAALRELLSRLAARAPLVLIVDDFHWADADSLALVADLMHRSDAPGLLFVWVVRTKPGDPLPLRLEELREQLGVVHVLDVNPLPEHDAMALASVLYERASGAKLTDARRVAEEARGNPLLIEELVRHVATAQEHSVDAARLDHALLERVGALEDGARRVVHVVATAGVPVRIAAVARTAGIALDSCARTVEDLCARNLLRLDGFGGRRDVSPYHERVREVVLRAMPDDVRTATHRAIARSLMSDDASDLDPQVVIRHLIMAGDLESAAAHAQRAADRAAEAFAFDRAAELYRVALRLAEGGDESEGQIKRSLALALSMAGRGPDAADVYLSIAETAEPDTGRECRRLASEQLLLTGHIGRGLRVLSTVLADFGIRLPSSPRRSLASLLWNRAKLRLRGMRFELRDATAIPPEDLSRLDVLYAVGSSMAMVDNICGADYQSRALLLALELGDRYRIVRSLATEAMLLGSQGKEAAANSLLQRGWQLVADDRDSSLLAYMTAARGTNHHFCGRFRPAIIDFDDAEELWMSGVAGSEFELAVVRIFRMYALRFVGDCHELRRQFDLHVREARRRNDRYVETTFTRAFNMVWLADDDPGQAREDLASSGWTPPKAGYHIQHWFKLRARAELALYVGDAASTREKQHTGFLRLKSSMLLRIKVIRSDVFWLTGRLALAEVMAGADPKPCQDHALAMARKLRAERIKYATAWAYMLRAAVHAQRGDHATSIRDLNEAADYAKRGELELTTAAIRRRRGQLIGGHDGAMIVAASDEWMRNHGVRNPARMTAMLLPGFDETLQM